MNEAEARAIAQRDCEESGIAHLVRPGHAIERPRSWIFAREVVTADRVFGCPVMIVRKSDGRVSLFRRAELEFYTDLPLLSRIARQWYRLTKY